MRNFIIFTISMALLILSFSSAKAENREFAFACDTCITADNFRAAATSRVPTVAGTHTVDVVNLNTNFGYRVIVEKSYETELRRWLTLVVGITPWTTQQKNAFIAAKAMFSAAGQSITIQAPDSYGTDSFGGSDGAAVGLLIASSPAMIGVRSVSFSLWGVLKAAFGRFPVAYVVFPNGDVAQYDIINPAGGATCCVYKDGTARDIDGNAIDAPASGGNYVSNDGGAGTPSNPIGQHIITSQGIVTCAYVRSGGKLILIGCRID